MILLLVLHVVYAVGYGTTIRSGGAP